MHLLPTLRLLIISHAVCADVPSGGDMRSQNSSGCAVVQ
uniref:Uncharacterized protein n=1 Tax=Anopheles minimus TaxID=112268 RepID=A0A182WNS2_9DIPT